MKEEKELQTKFFPLKTYRPTNQPDCFARTIQKGGRWRRREYLCYVDTKDADAVAGLFGWTNSKYSKLILLFLALSEF